MSQSLERSHPSPRCTQGLLDAARPRKCFSNITGYCRKKCQMGEIYEIACLNGKLCCVNEEENKKYVEPQKSPISSIKSDEKMDYVVLPTITLFTIQP
ncbi:beta-defensin 128 [Diceros bicornis minor]|uniref:beta-defensin 128 n=1 Tax=Diceros bicornis minor TaxID=77932 RepID=UPI0026E98C76|nr:beta-defensin 128 [Diceros bicornis minor]